MTEFRFTLVDVGEGLEEAEIVEWFVAPGDSVEPDQAVVAVETAKSVVELPTPRGGTVVSLAGGPGTVIPVGGVLAVIATGADVSGPATDQPAPEGRGDGANPPSIPDSATSVSPARPARPSGLAAHTPPPAQLPSTAVRAAPTIRRAAKQGGVDLREVTGNGPLGRVTRADLEHHLAQRSGSPPQAVHATAEAVTRTQPYTLIPFKGVRARIAETLAHSASAVPHIYDWRTAEATQLLSVKSRLTTGAGEPPGPSLFTLLARITLAALRRHAVMYARLDTEAVAIRVGGPVDLGLAIAGPAGLVVPVLAGANHHPLLALDAEIRRVTRSALDRTLAREELGSASFTVNNLGPLGAKHGSPLLRDGESGAIAFGRIREEVVAKAGQAAVAPCLGVTVVGDHRILDGADLCAFANTVVELIESPELLIAEL